MKCVPKTDCMKYNQRLMLPTVCTETTRMKSVNRSKMLFFYARPIVRFEQLDYILDLISYRIEFCEKIGNTL